MESENLTVNVSVSEESVQSSYLKTIIDLFFSPAKAFVSLKSKPRWVVPFILCTIFLFLQLAAKDNPNWDRYKQIIDFITIQQFLMAISIVLLSHSFKVFGLAFFIWLGLQLYPAKTSYIKILSIVSFSFLVILPETIIKLPLIFAKESPKVYLGAVALLPVEWHDSPLFNMFDKLDIFTIWTLVLITIAIPLVTEITKKQSYITIGYLYGIWLLLSMFVGNLVQIT